MKKRRFNDGGMSGDMSPEDVAEMKRRRAATRAYDRTMPEADTTFGKFGSSGNMEVKPIGRPRPDSAKDIDAEIKNLPGRVRPGTSLEDLMKKDKAKSLKKGGMTASKRADGIAQRGKTKGTMIMCGGGYTKGK